MPGPRAFPARSHLCLGGPAQVSRLGQAAVPALVVGMKIPGTNPTFRQDKSGISMPGMGQAAVYCINEDDRQVLPIPSEG